MSNTNLLAASGFITFENTDMRIFDRGGRVWLSAADLARALGYAKSSRVSELYQRNKHEFTGDMTQVITLQPNEINETRSLGASSTLEQSARVFSSRGCHLIAMLSRTEKAGMFRR